MNLGFGGTLPNAPTTMYTRIPQRFLPPEPAEVAADDEVLQEGSPAEAAPSRAPSRAMGAWSRARSMSTALLGLKLLTSMQHASPLGPLFTPMGPSSLPGSSPCPTPPGKARSVLHPDNQRALARQGFYGDQLPEGLEDELDLHTRDGEDGESKGRKKSAEDRRRQFHKTRSRRQPSLVESGEEESYSQSRDSHMKSVDFSTTTESTDSGGEMSTSAPTTPGDVFLDRVPSPLAGAAFPADRLLDMDDLYLPHRTEGRGPRLSDRLDVDSDVTPCASRQPTIEKAPTLTSNQLEEELGADGEGRGSGSRTSSTSTDPGRKTVSIIVSEDARRQHVTSSHTSAPPSSSGGGAGRAGMNFLNIVHAAMDRLSDSGSEHTLVDQQSSSSGSPRPAAGSDSPGIFPTTSNTLQAAKGSQQAQVTSISASPVLSSERPTGAGSATRQLERGPVLYVYHTKGSEPASGRDVNDNLPLSFSKQGQNLHPFPGSRHGLDEELPRMSSVQSDSSGFVDTEVSADNTVSDMASLKVSNLGSSCESSATMASTATVVGSNNGSHNHANSGLNYQTQTFETQTPLQSLQDSPDSHKRRSRSADDILNSESSAAGQRYITMCYIPHLNKPGSPHIPVSSIRDLLSSSSRDGRHSPRGPAHISVVLRGKGRGEGPAGRREGLHNELPLSEELAQASGRSSATRSAATPGGAISIAPRYSCPQITVPLIPRVAVQRATVDSSSVDGSRGSGDELERDDRSLSYSSWSRELPSSSSAKMRKPRPRYYPPTDEESGASVEGSSVYSCASTSDSITSGSGSPLLDYHKLIKLINQPTIFKGRRTRMVHYRPRRPLRDWPGLLKRKRLQEECRLAQYALHKFKTELNMMESAVMGRYNMAYDHLTPEERDDVEELQHLWAEVRHQAMETEQLLTLRMKSMAAGNDNFNFLSSIHVLQRLIDVLKEQTFQKQLDMEEEEDQEEVEEWEEERGGRYRTWGSSPRYSSLGSWGELPRASPRIRGRYSSSTSHLPLSPAFSEPSYDQFRSTLVSEMREEMRSNLQSLQQDLQKRDEEIHRLQLQLMMEGRSKKPRSTQPRSTRSQSASSRRRAVKETDV